MSKRTALALLQIVFAISMYSQPVSFISYVYPGTASTVRFSVDIPQSWKETTGDTSSGFLASFMVTDSSGNSAKTPCLDTVKYQFRYFRGTIAAALSAMGFQDRGGNLFMYSFNHFVNIVVAFEIKSPAWRGLDCSFKTKLPCKEKDAGKKTDAEIVCLFFSNGAETICLMGNGAPLEDEVLAKIEASFRFN